MPSLGWVVSYLIYFGIKVAKDSGCDPSIIESNYLRKEISIADKLN